MYADRGADGDAGGGWAGGRGEEVVMEEEE